MRQDKFYILILIISATIFTSNHLKAQKTNEKFINNRSLGGFISTGIPFYTLEEGTRYNPIIIGAAYRLPFYSTSGKFNIGLGLLPQIGLVPYSSAVEYEFGLNITFILSFELSENDIFSINLGTGPHYITASINRQASGFIFSDHLNFAYRHRYNQLEFGITAGIRHISNAGFEEPNLGIEDLGIGISVSKLLVR